jgi:dihydrofolate reductase
MPSPSAVPLATAIVAITTHDNGIGRTDGRLPWHPHRLYIDMAWLSLVTINGYEYDSSGQFRIKDHHHHEDEFGPKNSVILGRKTFMSLPEKMRPLPHRRNIVLTTTNGSISNSETADSLDAALKLSQPSSTFILGGKSVYEEAMRRGFPFLVTKIESEPGSTHADINLDLTALVDKYEHVDVTERVYEQVVRLRPELAERAKIVDGFIAEVGGYFRYRIFYYHCKV